MLKCHLTPKGMTRQKKEQVLKRRDGSQAFPNYILIDNFSTEWTIKHHRCLLELCQYLASRAGLESRLARRWLVSVVSALD